MERGTRIRVKFVKRGELKYISHLDLLRTMERAVRRSGLPIAYTEGFHPHAKSICLGCLWGLKARASSWI